MSEKHPGPFVLRFNTEDSYYSRYNGQYVRVTFKKGPGTHDLSEAKLFYKAGSAKSSAYGASCELVPVRVVPA